MKSVWKYSLELTDEQTLLVPSDFQILKVGVQDNVIQAWALVTPGDPSHMIKIRISGTGHPIDTLGFRYIDSVFQAQFVWHIWAGE